MKRIVSGIQSTGDLHLGNYLGTIRNWVNLQSEYQSLLFLADLHSITTPQDPIALKESTLKATACYIACGIDPDKSIIFAQSSIPYHAELAWIFSCMTPMGWLNRMIQFKEKAGKDKEKACLGLYSYPVLQAADILLYKAFAVPVGEDQKQHLELARDIADSFNRYVKKPYFNLPEVFILGEATRVMSLRDGTKKMSKSDQSGYSRINLTDSAEEIAKKLQKAKSDSFSHISYDPENRPEVSNLINIYSALSNLNKDQIIANYDGVGFAKFKKDLADIAVLKLSPISIKMQQLLQDKSYIEDILRKGKDKASAIAHETISEVKDLIGFVKL
jgi:tryptophanyl-tRNA synthetase